MPTDCRVVLQLQAECFRTQDDATMKVASTNATPSIYSPIDGRNIAPPVSVPDRGGRSLQTPSWMSVFTGPTRHQTGLTGQKRNFAASDPRGDVCWWR